MMKYFSHSFAKGSTPPPTTALVLAAGYGQRLHPMTSRVPKPLIPVAGKALLDHVFTALTHSGVRKVVVNVHYKAPLIEQHIKSHPPSCAVVFSDERLKLMDSGGAVVKALAHLSSKEPFWTHNADSFFWTPQEGSGSGGSGSGRLYQELAAQWNPLFMDALMLLVPTNKVRGYGGRGDFFISPQGKLTLRHNHSQAPYVWSGVQILAPRFFQDKRLQSRVFSMRDFWRWALRRGRLYGMVAEKAFWIHVSTPSSYKKVVSFLGDMSRARGRL